MTVEYGTPLREFAKGKSQLEVAGVIGVTQSAVSQMILSERDIRVVSKADGGLRAVEIRPVGSRRKPLAA
ncbi:Cro/Cl family transcriptional regulator [Pseudomonas sp. CVAP|uniref:Cro/Cl family transcriptional regulator n=1 Tax=unclassified Pseudomonas TaxID=196821 RepID=UPI001C1EF9AB|nr:Cro/Cl family transcriptional regulator [Pseudomonas sp. CVAP\